jgi:hypothetical protein
MVLVMMLMMMRTMMMMMMMMMIMLVGRYPGDGSQGRAAIPGLVKPAHPPGPQHTPDQLQKFEDSVSLVNAFTEEEIRAHISSLQQASLMTPQRIQKVRNPMTRVMMIFHFDSEHDDRDRVMRRSM